MPAPRRSKTIALAILAIFAAAPILAATQRACADDGRPHQDRRAEPPQLERLFDELAAPRLPTPFTLPELSHPDFDASLDWTVGTATPENPSRGPSTISLVRASGEARLGPLRRVYIGATLPLAAALPIEGTGASRALLGNPEGHIRVVFPMPSWLAFGAAFGATVPTASFTLQSGSEQAALAAASLEPTELVQLSPGTVALRPSIDARLLRGPFVLQVRDGVDLVVDSVGGLGARTLGRVLGHAGLLVTQDLEVSIEASQVYFFATEVPDDRRAALTIGPGVRWSLGDVDVGLGGVTNLLAPLASGMDRFVAVRASLVAHLR